MDMLIFSQSNITYINEHLKESLHMAKKILPIGMSDFRKIRENEITCYYVDKTLMIKDFIGGKEVSLITRPRRFGKTLNMTMIRDFFDITADSRGIFEGLDIMRTEYAAQLNTRPVVFLSLKGITGENVKGLFMGVGKVLREEYYKYEHVFANQVIFIDWLLALDLVKCEVAGMCGF